MQERKKSTLLIYRSDLYSLTVVVLHYGLMITSLVSFKSMGRLQIGLSFVLLSMTSFLVSVIVHNTVHHPIFHSRVLNKIFQYVLSFGQGHPVTAFVPGHNFSHHMHLNSSKDVMRSSQARFRWNFLNQFLFFFLVVPEIMAAEHRFAARMRDENPAWYRQWMGETILVHGLKVLLLLLNWKSALLFVWLPHLYGNWGIVGTNMWQHDGCLADHPFNHSRSITGKTFNAFLFNNGFHGAHHNNPGVHWSLLPDYHEKQVAPFTHPALLQTSLLSYLWQANFRPGLRKDLFGQSIAVPPFVKTEDWMADIDLRNQKHLGVLGADPIELTESPA